MDVSDTSLLAEFNPRHQGERGFLFMKKQAHVYYSGHVQGIGFRYALVGIANSQKVQGWVRNLDDGRVEVAAEAKEEDVNSFLRLVDQEFSRQIKEAMIEWLPATGVFRDLRVEF